MRTCRTCSSEFEIEKKPGRPPVKCNPCRGLKSVPVPADTAVEVKELIPDPLKVSLKHVAKKYRVSDFMDYLDEYPETVYMSSRDIADAIRSLTWLEEASK